MSSPLSSLNAFIIDLINGNTFHPQTRLIPDAQISASCLMGNDHYNLPFVIAVVIDHRGI